jgi:hypothetical protein
LCAPLRLHGQRFSPNAVGPGKTAILPCSEKPRPPPCILAPVRATSACSVPLAQYKIGICTPNNLLARIPPGYKASTKQRSSEPSSTIFLILHRKSNSRIEETRVRIQFSGSGWLKIASRPRRLTSRGPRLEFTRAIHGIQFHFEGPQARAPNGWRIAAGIRERLFLRLLFPPFASVRISCLFLPDPCPKTAVRSRWLRQSLRATWVRCSWDGRIRSWLAAWALFRWLPAPSQIPCLLCRWFSDSRCFPR